MIVCENCKKEIKFISHKNKVIICEKESVDVFTDTGRLVTGYPIHNCKGIENGKTESELTES